MTKPDIYDRFIEELTAKRYFDWRGALAFIGLVGLAKAIAWLVS